MLTDPDDEIARWEDEGGSPMQMFDYPCGVLESELETYEIEETSEISSEVNS
jgi:hypothetical protein